MTVVWSKRSGTKLASLQESQYHSVDLPVESSVSIEIISGEIPPGMALVGNSIQGIPNEVARSTQFRFVLRANNPSGEIFDRTYSIEIVGADDPVWITPPDLLPVGKNGTFFILDSSPVDYQLEALDTDTAAGQQLRYFIASDDGELPPGITLTEDGRLVGVVDPILALEKEAEQGNYSEGRFDRYPYDFAVQSTSGFSSFFYDVNPFDFQSPTQVPKKLNRYYQFRVSVSDGDSVAKREFRIFVVGDDFLRADNVIMQVGTGVFTADNTYLRSPIWLTPSELGVKRANNFITVFLETLDPANVPGLITYDLLSKNDDGTDTELPPGTEFDRNTGEIFGRVPYQPAVTKTYKFSVRARRIESGTNTIALQKFAFEFISKNSQTIKINKLQVSTNTVVDKTFSIGPNSYKVISVNTFDSDFDVLSLDKPLFTDVLQGQEIDLGTVLTASQEVADSEKTFTLQLIGEIDSTISWQTPRNLGSIPSNYISILKVEAETNVPNSFLLYTLESGSLPPGLELAFSGEIIGKVDNSKIDQNTVYEFSVKARDQFGFSAIERTFILTVVNADDTVYSNIYYKPLLPQQQRTEFLRLVGDSEVFVSKDIYRPQDSNFGIQRDIKILIYAGIETKTAEQYVAAAAKFAARKTLKIRDVKKAVAKQPGTNNEIYEVVYLDVYDPYEHSGDVAKQIKTGSNEKITVDSIRTTTDNDLYDTESLSYIFVGTRFKPEYKIYFDALVSIQTRLENINWQLTDDISIDTRDNSSINVNLERGSSTNIFYRPEYENTIRADSSIALASDPVDKIRFISNTSNIRDNLRTVGETERQFLPLWMKTAQPGTLQELGFTMAVPLAYCKPGTADRIISGIRTKNIDFRQFQLEVDRFLIDATEGNSNEQYIVFSNYRHTIT
jgi:hypothetical protein